MTSEELFEDIKGEMAHMIYMTLYHKELKPNEFFGICVHSSSPMWDRMVSSMPEGEKYDESKKAGQEPSAYGVLRREGFQESMLQWYPGFQEVLDFELPDDSAFVISMGSEAMRVYILRAKNENPIN